MRLRILLLLPVPLLHGCFFFYIPGSFIDAAADGLSGAQGTHCVAAGAKIGDTIAVPNSGVSWRVVSIDGTSYRCTKPEHPIRAKLEPITS